MNKLRLSMYLCTPSGTKSKDVALLLLSLSILHYFSKAPKKVLQNKFVLQHLLFTVRPNLHIKHSMLRQAFPHGVRFYTKAYTN